MNKVYLIVNCEGHAVEFDSWEEVTEELEDLVWEDSFLHAERTSVIVADAEEIAVSDLESDVKAVFVRYGYGENIVYWAHEYKNFDSFKTDLMREDHMCMVEEIGFDMYALSDIKEYRAKFTVIIEEV